MKIIKYWNKKTDFVAMIKDPEKYQYRLIADEIAIPFHFFQDETETIKNAIRAFFIMQEKTSPEDFEIVINYVRYYVNAPCWKKYLETIEEIISASKTIESITALKKYLMLLLNYGIDPL